MNLTRGFHKFRGDYIEYSGDAYVRLYWWNWGESGRIVLRVDNYHGHRVSFVLVDTLVEYSDSVWISFSLILCGWMRMLSMWVV